MMYMFISAAVVFLVVRYQFRKPIKWSEFEPTVKASASSGDRSFVVECNDGLDDFDDDDRDDDDITYEITEVMGSEKERKWLFDRQQALLDADFLVGQLDILYQEYHGIIDDLDIVAGRIKIKEAMREVDKLKREYKERDQLNKRLLTVSGRIHNTEKKLRTAQFKAGLEITC